MSEAQILFNRPKANYSRWEDLRDEMLKYFELFSGRETISGLCLYLGFSSIKGFAEYKENDPGFKCLINGFIESLDEQTKQFIYARYKGNTKKRADSSLSPLHRRIKSNMYSRLNQAIRGKKSNSFHLTFGYTQDQLIKHLESKFYGNINWDNYGKYWHIDHIKPVSWYDWKDLDNGDLIKECWGLNNLQPLPAIINSMKGNRYSG